MPLSRQRSRKAPSPKERRDPFFKKEGSQEGFFFANAADRHTLHTPTHSFIQLQSDRQTRQRAQSRISTPLPATATITRQGTATLTINGVQVTIQSDRRTRSRAMQNRAETTSRRRYAIAAPRLDRQGQITAFSQPTVTVTIQTTYGPGVSGEAVSGYGRGTTATDVSAGQTTLRFHEGSHGQDYLDYLSTNPPPTLQATVGMTIAEFRQAQQEYQQAFEAYFQAMDQASLHQTDCVGTTIDQATGSQVCPTP